MDTPKNWQKNLEMIDIYYKYYLLKISSLCQELLDDSELPDNFRESILNMHDAISKALTDYHETPIFPTIFRRNIKEREDGNG